MRELLTVVVFEMFIVMVAMGWDFASGYYKAKLRGEERNSYGMRRTVSKFILYAGSVCIACGIDSVCYECRFWEFIHLPFLTNVPVVSRGYRNNNPGNIQINGDLFQGEIRPSKDKSFKQFETMAYGYRAIFKILSNYYRNYKLDTIRKMIGRWAPENENETDAYVKAVSDYAGIPADDPININDREQMIRIVAGMSRVENGREAEMSDVIAGWNLL